MKIFFKFRNKIFVFILFFIFLFFFSGKKVNAVNFRTDYQVTYDLSSFGKNEIAKVSLKIKITNLKSDVYVSRFAISFPRSFLIFNLKVNDDYGEVKPNILTDEDNFKIEMAFNNPNVGANSTNQFFLDFEQKNLFKENGNVWEVLLPVIENETKGESIIKVVLPENYQEKKISLAKPKPNFIEKNEIVWVNPQKKTIYAVFGDKQIYRLNLAYNLKNKEIYPISTEIAFPPDTNLQKIIFQKINFMPNAIYQDSDGNLLGRYFLKPLEEKIINFDGYLIVYAKPREEVVLYQKSLIDKQKRYLLKENNYWSIKNLEKISSLNTPFDIYQYSVKNFQYNYNKLKKENIRLGGDYILNYLQGVCLEFTDFFIAVSREKGILAREIQGYGFSFDPKLQPLSLASDILHSWPEYYDKEKELWLPVDPTWANTSKIDYFSSFDLNHLVFVIHGQDPDYPLPAGTYKINDSKDIFVEPVKDYPQEIKKISLKKLDLPKTINLKKNYQGKFTVKNEGNVYLYQVKLFLKGKGLQLDKKQFLIGSIAPYEEKTFDFNFQAASKNKVNLKIFNDKNKLIEKEIKVIDYLSYYLISIPIAIFLLFFFLKKR